MHHKVLDIHRNIFIHRYISCLHEIEIQIYNKYGYLIGLKNRLDTKLLCTLIQSYYYKITNCLMFVCIITYEYLYACVFTSP